MNCTAPGDRGIGRLTDEVPRLGARHRQIISRISGTEQHTLRRLLRRHILCGYAFYEFGYESDRARGPDVPADRLFDMWIQTLYTPFSRAQGARQRP